MLKGFKLKNMFFVTSIPPNPNGSGIERRCYRNLTSLMEFTNVHTIIVNRDDNGSALKTSLDTFGITNVTVLGLKENSNKSQTFPGALICRELLSYFGDKIEFEKDTLAALLHLIKATEKFDVFVFRLYTFPIYKVIFKTILTQHRLILDWDDIESIALQRANNTNKEKFGKEVYWSNKIRIQKNKKIERATVQECEFILVCSEKDAKAMNTHFTTNAFVSIPNSFDFQPKPSSEPAQNHADINILFVGSMYYPPNEHGAVWFCTDVLPIIMKSASSNVTVWIVGYKPTNKVQQLAEIDNVVVTGSVDSMTEYYEKATFAISPIHFGGGTRIKILEAASFRVPTVTTSIGLEGIEFNHMEDVLIADSANEFAKSCLTLIDNKQLRVKLSASAFKTGKKLYDHSIVTDALNTIIKEKSTK
jgi:glycosyltransferase involved in cell wall biosynthesis